MLIRIDPQGWKRLYTQWEAECEASGEKIAEFAAPYLDHARNICDETPAPTDYAVFGLERDGRIDAILHANVARLPSTTGKTLRLLWVLLSPRFDFEEIEAVSMAKISADLLFDAVTLSNGEMQAEHIKLHLTSFGDTQFFAGIVAAFSRTSYFKAFAIRANWLHITK